jgi:hypothetical protein
MTSRERYVNTLLFRKTDRVPLDPGKGRESTHRNWHAQGLPAGVDSDQDILLYAYREAGGKEELPEEGEGFPMVWQMIPQFEETILERGERTQIVQDWKGNICEISNDFDPRYLRDPIDFVTRRWIKCPVSGGLDRHDDEVRSTRSIAVARRCAGSRPATPEEDMAPSDFRLGSILAAT